MICDILIKGLQDFKSKKIRVNLDQLIEAEVRAESNAVLKTVDEGRNYVIQATIIRYALLHPTQANVCMKHAWPNQRHESEENDES